MNLRSEIRRAKAKAKREKRDRLLSRMTDEQKNLAKLLLIRGAQGVGNE